MLLTDRKRRLRAVKDICDYLAVWRFVREHCFECGWEGVALVPFDLDDFDRNGLECGACQLPVARVMGVVPDLPALPLTEARRRWAEQKADGWEPEFFPLIASVDDHPTSQRGVLFLT